MRIALLPSLAALLALTACGDDTSGTTTAGGGGSPSSTTSASSTGGDGATSGPGSTGSGDGGGSTSTTTTSTSAGGGDAGSGGGGGDGSGGAQTFAMTDDLRGSTAGLQVGGQLGEDGWTVTGNADRVIYELPRLVSGSFQFTVTGMTLDNLPFRDHEIFAMYEGGYAMEEPIDYNPEYRENHYKAMIRVYGQQEEGRVGQQKIMWGMCPSGAPGYGACGCESFFEEPFGGDGTWDGSPQVLRVEWGDGVTRYLRNGVEILAVDWSASGLTFAPDELHASLGTSRPLEVGDASMPVGAVFSDVIIEGVIGDAPAACPP